jgi:hypothetical protein
MKPTKISYSEYDAGKPESKSDHTFRTVGGTKKWGYLKGDHFFFNHQGEPHKIKAAYTGSALRRSYEAGPKTPEGDGQTPSTSAQAGRTPHTHELRWDDEGNLASHGPASAGEPHNHEIAQKADGVWFLAAAVDDKDDPDHTHEIKPEINQAESRTRAGRILSQLGRGAE